MKNDTANYIKAAIVLVLIIIGCSTTGCSNKASEEIIEKHEETEIIIADEFQIIYSQPNYRFNIIRHIPTDMLYIQYVGCDLSPMNMSYEEYVEKAKLYHKENDIIPQTEPENKNLTD